MSMSWADDVEDFEEPMTSELLVKALADFNSDMESSLNTLNPGGFTACAIKVQHASLLPSIQDLEITVNVRDVELIIGLELKNDFDQLSASSVLSGRPALEIKTTAYEWSKDLGHDYIYKILAPATDTPLSIIAPLKPGEKEMTPDWIIQFKDGFCVTEFTTSRSIDQNHLIRQANQKIAKYDVEVRRRQQNRHDDKKVILTATNVNRYCVASGVTMPQALVNELVLRKRVSEAMMTAVERHGYKLDVESTEDVAMVTAALKSITPHFGSAPNQISKEDYDRMDDPIDGDKLISIFKDSIDLARLELQQPYKKTLDNPSYQRFMNQAMDETDKKVSQKRVINLPLVLCAHNFGIDIDTSLRTNDGTAIARLISQCFKTCSTHDEDANALLARAQLPLEDAAKEEEELRPHRMFFNRCSPRVTRNDEKELSVSGLYGKKFCKDNEGLIAEKKKHLSFNSDVSDIDYDMNNLTSWMLEADSWTTRNLASVNTLIESAIASHGLKYKSCHELHKLTQTKGAKACYISSAIAQELSISAMQHVKKGEYILKRIRDFDCYILIRPTDSDKHIFYSIIIPTVSYEETAMRSSIQFTRSGDVWHTDFVSTDITRLVNYVNLFSSFLCTVPDVIRWLDMPYELLTQPAQIALNKAASRHIAFRLMVHMENKNCTEGAITNYRYPCMASLSKVQVGDGSWKSFLCQDTLFRSRLQIWVIRQQIAALSYNHDHTPSLDHTNVTLTTELKDKYTGIFDYVSDTFLTSVSQLVETFYIGYESDKNKMQHQNADKKLTRKIIEEEMKFYEANPLYMGKEDIQGTPKPHEFSITIARAMTERAIVHFQKELGMNWRERLAKDVKLDLARITFEEMATLKASCNVKPSDGNLADKKDPKPISRTKVAGKVLEYLSNLTDESLSKKAPPIVHVPHFLHCLEQLDAVYIDLFKKPQQGDTREIYVMTYATRQVQVMIERIAKTLNTFFESETMAHPNHKTEIPTRHYRTSSALSENQIPVSFMSSEDKTRWNQRIVCKLLGLMMCRCLPEEFHGLIINVMNLWSKKRILLPIGIQRFLKKAGELQYSEDISTKILLDGFYGEDERVLSQGSCFMKIQTGMMQGIFHAASSLLHVLSNDLSRALYYRVCDPKRKTNNAKILIDFICSSDDSASFVTVVSNDRRLSTAMAALYMYTVPHFLKHLSMYDSEKKSARCLYKLVEFNSVWYASGSVVKPIIKWVPAALTIPSGSSLISRQEHFSVLLTQLLESGAPIKLVHCVQIAQAYLHYSLLGSVVHPIFFEYAGVLTNMRDPNLGFFLMDPYNAAGVMGFDFNNYVALTSCEQYSRRIASVLKTDAVETTPLGTVSTSALVRFGPRAKYMKFMRDYSPGFEWSDHIEENPHILYKGADTLKDEIVLIMRKLTSEGVPDAFSPVSRPLRLIAASVYSISHLCIELKYNRAIRDEVIEENRKRKRDDDIKHESRAQRTSLFRLASERYQNAALDNKSIEWMFPAYQVYETMLKVFRDYSFRTIEVPNTKQMKGQTTIHLPKYLIDTYSDVLSACKMVWFGVDPRAHKGSVLESWRAFKTLMPWLRDSEADTLRDSPFELHAELYDYLSRVRSKARILSLTSSPISKMSHLSMIENLIRKDQWPLIELKEKPDFVEEQRSIHTESLDIIRDLCSKVYLLYMFPLIESTRLEKLNQMLEEAPYFRPEEYRRFSKKLAKLAFIANSTKGLKKDDWIALSSLKDSIVGCYTQVQKFSKKTGTYGGIGIWYGWIAQYPVRITINDKNLEKIETPDPLGLSGQSDLVRMWAEDNGITRFEGSGNAGMVFDGKAIKSALVAQGATQVINCPLAHPPLRLDNYTKISLRKESMTLRVSMEIEGGSGKTMWGTICSMGLSQKDLRISMTSNDTAINIFESWVEQIPLDENTFMAFVNTLVTNESSGSQREPGVLYSLTWNDFSSDASSWFRQLLKIHLTKQGIPREPVFASCLLESSVASEEDAEDGHIEVTHDLLTGLEEFTVEALLDIMHSFDPPKDDPEPFDYLGFITAFNEFDFTFDAAKLEREPRYLAMVHPMLSNIALRGELSRHWWNKTLEGLMPRANQELCKQIQILLNVGKAKERTLRRKMQSVQMGF